jgi:hypothetical protein
MILAAAIAAGAVFAWRNGEGAVRRDGPLALPHRFSDASGSPAKLGAAYSWGGIYLSNRGTKTATVDRIMLVGKPTEMRLIGMYAVRLKRSMIGLLEGYSTQGPRVQRLSIRPGETYQVVVGVKVETPGRFLISAVRVRYHIDDARYEELFHQRLRLCAPARAYENCPVLAENLE